MLGSHSGKLLGKIVCFATRHDVEEVSGVSQLYTGSRAKIKGAINALNELFRSTRVMDFI